MKRVRKSRAQVAVVVAAVSVAAPVAAAVVHVARMVPVEAVPVVAAAVAIGTSRATTYHLLILQVQLRAPR
jgi:hypothetical protein